MLLGWWYRLMTKSLQCSKKTCACNDRVLQEYVISIHQKKWTPLFRPALRQLRNCVNMNKMSFPHKCCP